MLDLTLFPAELDLFESESSWRFSDRMAIVNDAEDSSLDQAETILNLNGFKRRDLEMGLLERYYTLGDEAIIEEERLPGKGRLRSPPLEPELKPFDEGVIMPEAIMPRNRAPTIYHPDTTRPTEMELPTSKPSPAEERTTPRATDEKELIKHVIRYIRTRGFFYAPRLVKNYYTSLKTKPLVILTGYTGLGKTALTRLFAEAISDDVEEQYLRLSVQPNWLDDKNLMGFYNPNTGRYVTTPFLELLLEAAADPDKPYFLCLDEMSQSPVEYYFSRFLSAMESIDGEISLHVSRGGVETDDGRVVPPKVKIPRNLFISGTINIDESPHMLSPKLLDHANIIEFFEVDLKGHSQKKDYQKRLALDMGALDDFRETLKPSDEARVVDVLVEVNEKTIKHGFPVSYRVRQEVLEYVANSIGIFSRDDEENLKVALDIQIKQRVLTKIAGTETLRPLLDELQQYFDKRLPLSAEKVGRMLERLEELGFTSFCK